MAFADLVAQLAGMLPGLSPLLARTYVAEAWREIRDERSWSFKTAQAALICPVAIQTGFVNVTQFSNTLTFNAAATTALTPFVAGTPLLTTMQIRFGGGPLYRIVGITTPNPLVVTVDRPIVEVTNIASAYSVYRAYIQPPVSDFVRWESFDDYANGIAITKDRLTQTSVWFDLRDPQRQSVGPAIYLGSLLADTVGNIGMPIYELWPHPTGGQTFLVTFKRRGADLVLPTDIQPDVIPDSLILDRALGWHAYLWAQANRGRFPALAKTDFTGLTTATRQAYVLQLNTLRLRDEDLMLESVYNRGHWGGTRSRFDNVPLGDARYWQSHPITW